MRRRRGDVWAVLFILVGAAAAWAGTSLVLTWVAVRSGEAAMESLLAAAALTRAVGDVAEASAGRSEVGEVLEAGIDTPGTVGDGGVAFRASSLGSGFVVQGDYAGRLVAHEGSVRLTVPLAHIRNAAVLGDETVRLAGVRLSLADETEHGWRIVRSGEVHSIGRTLKAGEELWFSDLELELAGVTEEEAVGRWLVVEHLLGEIGQSGAAHGTTYAHAPRDVLAALFGWIESGC